MIHSSRAMIDGYDLDSHPLICHILKGVFKLQTTFTQVPSNFISWTFHVPQVTGPKSGIAFKHKLALLLALITAHLIYHLNKVD